MTSLNRKTSSWEGLYYDSSKVGSFPTRTFTFTNNGTVLDTWNEGYTIPSGLRFVPSGEKLRVLHWHYNAGGSEYSQCKVEVLYGDVL